MRAVGFYSFHFPNSGRVQKVNSCRNEEKVTNACENSQAVYFSCKGGAKWIIFVGIIQGKEEVLIHY